MVARLLSKQWKKKKKKRKLKSEVVGICSEQAAAEAAIIRLLNRRKKTSRTFLRLYLIRPSFKQGISIARLFSIDIG